MVQQARPALQALLGARAGSEGGGNGASGGSSRGQGGGRWVSGEGLAEVAARLGVGQPTLVDILDSLLAPERDERGRAGLEALQVGHEKFMGV